MLKMAKRKAKRNAATSDAPVGFKIRRQPIIGVATDAPSTHITNSVGLPHLHGPILFAIARDTHTIFVTWHIDWRSVFTKGMPVDRQVHLRLVGESGVEKRVAIEPMSATHYLTTPGTHDSYRVEIGYFQPADTWNSVATSEEIAMLPSGFSESSDIDLATIPFHLGFQQLLNLFKPTSATSLAVVISRFEQRVLSDRHQRKQLSLEDKKILHRLGFSTLKIAVQRHRVDQTQRDKLSRRARTLLALRSSSPASGFQAERTSAGS